MYFCLHPEYFVKLFRCVRQKGAENLSIRFISTKRFKTETSRIFFLHQASCYNFKLVKLHKGDFLEKWGNQSKKQLCNEKSLIQGLAPRLSTLLKTVRVQVLRTTIFFLLLFDTLSHKTTIYILREDDNLILGYSL